MKKYYFIAIVMFVFASQVCAQQNGVLNGKKVLFVYGGWDGHDPKLCKDLFVPWLQSEGAEVFVSDSLGVYKDETLMAALDLVVQVWTMGEIKGEEEAGLLRAVKNGVGIAGWHGGLGDSFRNNTEYQFMVGGQWVAHPGGVIDYDVNITDPYDPVTAGLEDFKMKSEQYYMHIDPNVKVLATTRFNGEHASWIDGCVLPVVWKKTYGKGRVFYSSLGHVVSDFEVAEALEIMKRGIRWAAMSKYEPEEPWLKPAYPSGKGWTDLFNGKDFDGFTELNGQVPFRAENGMMIGTSVKGQPNSFMATNRNYGDFILEFDVQCDPSLNSGVQFRSLSKSEYNNGRVHGYQCEIDPSDRAWSGGIFDEARRGWLVTLTDNAEGRAAYNKTGWNHYRIEAFGDTMRIWLNGVNTSNLIDDETKEGFIAFQVHSIGNDDSKIGKEVKWKNIRVMTENVRNNLSQGKLAPEVFRVANKLSSEELAKGWKLLFDGETTKGWRGAGLDAFPEKGWSVENGILKVCKAERGGDIITENQYSAFILSLEFLVTPGANSGIKYFVVEHPERKTFAYGPEYQVLDDKLHADANLYTSFPGSRKCAGLYDLIAPQNIRFNGVNQWNQAVIKVFPDNHVEHWLNGFKTLEYERCSDAFRELVKRSKFADKAYNQAGSYGEAPKGHILLQDHGDNVYYRSIKIKELK